MKFGLSTITIHKIQSLFRHYPQIEEVIIYGSRAKGSFRAGSDIDIVVKGTKITDEIRSKVWLELDALNTPYQFDLGVYHLIQNNALLDHIQRVGKTLYTNDDLINTMVNE